MRSGLSQVGLLAHGQGADLVVQPDGPGGSKGEGGDGVLQRQAECHHVLQLGEQVGGGAGQGVGPAQGGLAALHLDGLPAQLILAVGHAGAAQGVADDDQLVSKQLVGGPDDGGMDVQAVTDQLHRGAAVQGRADDPGLPVEEGGHGVEEVGGVAGPRTIGRHGGLIAGSGVAEGDGAWRG